MVKNWHLFFCVACGLWGGLIIGIATEYFTSNRYQPVQVRLQEVYHLSQCTGHDCMGRPCVQGANLPQPRLAWQPVGGTHDLLCEQCATRDGCACAQYVADACRTAAAAAADITSEVGV